MNPIKVVLVEDSLVALEVLERLLNSAPEINVVGTARDGAEALTVIDRTNPDVICTDLVMPNMDGLEFTQKLTAKRSIPVLVISNSVHPSDMDNIYNLMKAGAADFFPKPNSGSATDYEKLKNTLVTKIKVLSAKKR
jgi:chemotaxis response regulator CheB